MHRAFRAAQRSWSEVAGAARRQLSEAAGGRGGAAGGGGKPDPLSAESPTASRLFENVRMPVEGAAAGASGAAAAEAAAAELPGLRGLAALGNAAFFGGLSAAAFFGYYQLRYDADQVAHMVEETSRPENAFPGAGLWAAALSWYVERRRALEAEMQKYADPPSDRLLPDLPPHARHVRTLVLDLDDVLVHSHWTRGRGWRTFKRPGAEDFIRDMAQYYELVVYTAQLPTYADPILDRLDPGRLVQYRLYRDSTQYVGGRHVRDLSKLNRDLGQVLLVTADPNAAALQPDSAIKLPKWTLEAGGDTMLLDLIPFLEAIVRTSVPDVRAVVKSYEGEDIPAAFRERMGRVAAAKAQREAAPRGFLARAR
jgi:import inner membrane translocase subunit TIM50